MLAFVFLLAAVCLLLRWYYNPAPTPVHDKDGFHTFLSNTREDAIKPASFASKLQKCSNALSFRSAAKYNVLIRGNGPNKASLNVPETILSFGQGMGIFLNKIIDRNYVENMKPLVGSLGRFISRTAAHEYTAKCTVEETHRCALEWTTRDNVELYTGVAELTQKAVVRTLMGDDFYDSSDELLAILHKMNSDMGDSWSSVLLKWLPHSADRRTHRAVERIRDIFTEKLMRRDAKAVAGGPIKSDLQDYVTYILNERDTAQLKHLYCYHHAAIMLAAQSSTASTITLVIACLLRHPDVMNAVKRDARGGHNHPVLLQACIKETIRYYTNMMCSRQALQDTFSKDSAASLPSHLPYHSPASFHHSDSWMPGRWLNAENKLVEVEEKDTNEGFGSESKQCPGERMSVIIITQALTTLLRCYDISWASPTQPQTIDFEVLDLKNGSRLGQKDGLRVRISRRVWPELMAGC